MTECFFESNLYGHPLALLLWERTVDGISAPDNLEKRQKLGMLILPSSTNCSCQCTSATSSGSQRKLGSDVGNTCERRLNTPLVDQVDVGCSERAATIYEETIIPKTETLHRITTSHVEERPPKKKSHNTHKVSSWCYDMTSHAEERVERFWNLAKKSVLQLTEAETPCTDDHQLKNYDLEMVGGLSLVCAKIVFFEKIVPGQDERDGEECRVEGRRVSYQIKRTTKRMMT